MAGKVSYKNLFQLVNEQIEKRVGYNTSSTYSDQLSHTSITPDIGNSRSDVSTAELVTAIQNLLSDALPNWIINGLEVTATSPISDNIKVSAGRGAVSGNLYELIEDVNLTIPFDGSTELFYITLYKDNIYIDRTLNSERLTIAKIVIPEPGVTCYIQDDKDTSWNAYIVNFKEYKLYGHNDKFEEDTVELLRDNISPILADNLIGNIRLSEDLTISNTQGTMELDSAELRLLSTAGTTIAKFNRNGTFFYNDSGDEIARFGVNDARVGNILITKNTIGSGNFISENRGFKIQDDGYAEFEDVRIRGKISSSVFERDTISAVGGKLIVANSSVLKEVLEANSTTISTDEIYFSLGEILVIRDGTNTEYLEVLNINSNSTYTVERNLNGVGNLQWEKGTAIISTGIGISGQQTGFIILDTSSNYSPFIDINSRNSEIYSDLTTKVRLGNLVGISDSDYGLLSGFGLYSDNVFLKGSLYSPTIKTSISGARIELTTSNFIVYDISENQVFKISISGGDNGDVVIGDTVEGNYLQWDNSTDTFSLCSSIIESGVTNKVEIKDGCIVANRLQMLDPACDCNYSYLDSGYLRFHDRLGDIPYIKRIANGTSCTGDTICLVGWNTQPKVQVGIKSLISYKATNPTQDQKWEISSSTPLYFCTSNVNYGYCFNVYACLILSEGTGAEVVKDVNFETSVCTAVCVCGTKVNSKFQLWCNNAAPSNYYYGTICYALCYRKVGDTTWYACCDSYIQPHGSSTDLKSTNIDSFCLLFPCNGQWEIRDYCITLGFTDSGICATGTCWYYYQVTCCCCNICTCYCTATCNLASCCVCYVVNKSGTYYCLLSTDFAVTPPSNTYSSVFTANMAGCLISCAEGCCAWTGSAECLFVWIGSWSNLMNPQISGNVSTTFNCNRVCSYNVGITCVRMDNCRVNGQGTSACTGLWSCLFSSSILYCYCVVVDCSYIYYVNCCCLVNCGDAASCVYMKLYSLTDTYGCQCVLDDTGCLNWLAIAYS